MNTEEKNLALGVADSISYMSEGRVPKRRSRINSNTVLGVLGWAALIVLLLVPLVRSR